MAASARSAIRVPRSAFRPFRGSRPGFALVGALWVMTFMALIVVAYVAAQQVELKVAFSNADRLQARHLARSGIDHAVAVLMADETVHDTLADAWRDDAASFEQAAVGDGYYSLFAPSDDDPAARRFGMTDENGKVNLNTAPKEILEKVPGMTAALAEAVIDWRDTDEQTTGDGGAESDYYARQDPPYAAKNGPFDSVEELLMVKGFTAALLLGEDANRNGILDPSEADGDDTVPSDNRDEVLDRGLFDYLTVWSYEPNTAPDGKPRVNVNEASPSDLQNRLGEVLSPPKIAWIAEYRKASLLGNPIFPDGKYPTPAAMIPIIPVPGVQGDPVTLDDYRKIVNLVTVTPGERIEGRINVNTAPLPVLKALPQISAEEVDAIDAERKREDADLANPTWVVDVLKGSDVEALVKYQALEPFLTVRSLQFQVQSVGVVPGRGATARLLAVIDRAALPPRFLDWKDLSGLGAPFRPPTREEWEQIAGDAGGVTTK
jgi:type II secretory pathway component PulK